MELKQWTTPQLVVLGRGTPEESILGFCKITVADGPAGIACGKDAYNRGCLCDCGS